MTLEQEFEEFKSTVKKTLEEINRTVQSLKQDILKNIKGCGEMVSYCASSLKNNEKFLQDVKHTNENVEETLCNVLVAIRQNEYLQAWHPPQNGFPEMKVIGKHPCKVK